MGLKRLLKLLTVGAEVTMGGTELSMGPFCATRSNPTHQLTVPTQPNPQQMENFGPNLTQPNTTNNGAYCLVVTYFYTQN